MSRSVRRFYVAAAVVILLLTVWGFKAFYFHGQSYPGRPIPPPIRTLVVIHGIAMTLWVLLFMAQSLLVTAGRYRTHMSLGRIGSALAIVIAISGWMLAIKAAVVTPPEVKPWGFPAEQFLVVPMAALALFAGFVVAGIIYRGRADIHRNCMLMATVSAASAAIARIDPLSNMYLGTIWQDWFGPSLMTAVLAVLLTVAKSLVARSFDRILAAGCVIYAAVVVVSIQGAPSHAWSVIAGLLMGR